MMHLRTLFLIFMLCVFTQGCVNAAKNSSVVANQNMTAKVNPPKNNDAIEYLEFAETYSNLFPDMQKQTLSTTNQALVLNKNDIAHRMKLVMIYGLPSSSLLDTVKAQNLLQQILQEDILSNSQLAFAHILFDYLVVANKVTKNNGDDQKRVDSLQQKNEALQLKLEAAQQKLEASQQKLEASEQKLNELKKIEKSMGERDSKPK